MSQNDHPAFHASQEGIDSPTSQREPSLLRGELKNWKGTAEEIIGNITNSQTWKESGQKDQSAGLAEYEAARARGWLGAVSGRAEGKKDELISKIKSDRSQIASSIKDTTAGYEKEFNNFN